MRSYDEDDTEHVQYAKELNAPEWMIKLVSNNPPYVHWGNFENYMNVKGSGWNVPFEVDNIKKLPKLDDYNECVNYYFNIEREGHNCPYCDGSGFSKKGKELSDSYCDTYDLENSWFNKLEQDEVDFLVKEGCFDRFFKNKGLDYKLSAEEVNKHNQGRLDTEGELAVVCNLAQYYAIEFRTKKLGYAEHCESCNGAKTVYTKEEPSLQLQVWMIQPRTGSSRGILVKDIQKSELPEVFAWLKVAADRSQVRFSQVLDKMQTF